MRKVGDEVATFIRSETLFEQAKSVGPSKKPKRQCWRIVDSKEYKAEQCNKGEAGQGKLTRVKIMRFPGVFLQKTNDPTTAPLLIQFTKT